MLTTEFAQSALNTIITLFILSMLKLKFGNTGPGKAIHFITGS